MYNNRMYIRPAAAVIAFFTICISTAAQFVDMRDFGILESGWVETYGLEDLALMAQEWLLCSDPDNPSQCIETCATE